MIDLTEKLMELQNSQMKMIEKLQKRAEDLLLKLEADQRKLDEEARRRDRVFSANGRNNEKVKLLCTLH